MSFSRKMRSKHRPSLVLTTATQDTCNQIGDTGCAAHTSAEVQDGTCARVNDPAPAVSRICVGRELLSPPSIGPRMRKAARQRTQVGEDRSQEGSAGSFEWFLKRRSHVPREVDGLSLSFLHRFGGLHVESSDASSFAESESAGSWRRDSWKASDQFSNSDRSTSYPGSFNGSFGNNSTVSSEQGSGSFRCSPQNIVSPTGRNMKAAGTPQNIVSPTGRSMKAAGTPQISNSWLDFGGKSSLVGKRQRSPGGLMSPEFASGSYFGSSVPLQFGCAAFGGEEHSGGAAAAGGSGGTGLELDMSGSATEAAEFAWSGDDTEARGDTTPEEEPVLLEQATVPLLHPPPRSRRAGSRRRRGEADAEKAVL